MEKFINAGAISETKKLFPFRPKPKINRFWLGVIVTIVVIGLGYLIFILLRSGGVEFGVVGPNEVKAGEPREFKLIYQNNSRISLEDGELLLNLGDGVVSLESPNERILRANIGEIKSGEKGEQIFKLMFFGENRASRNLEAVFHYRPKTITSLLEQKTNYLVVISGSTFKVDMTLPQQVLPEQDFPMNISWENQSENNYQDVKIKIDWPENYNFASALPQPSEQNNIWYLGQVPAGGQNKIDINGSLSGQEGISRKFVVNVLIYLNDRAFVLNQVESYLAVIPNPLVMSASVNGDTVYNANISDDLNFRITYRNDHQVGLRNVVIKAKLDGSMFDFSTLKAYKGYFSSKDKTITWNSTNMPELIVLNPGESGEINFSIKTLKNYVVKSAADKNLMMTMKATIDTTTIPEAIGINSPIKAAAQVIVKINTKADLLVSSFYRDAPANIINAGKLPLRVGQPVQFTIHWKIKNYTNAINNVVVKTILPTGVTFTGRLAGNMGENQVTYNDRTGEVIWTLDNIPANSGILTKAYEAIFQIEATPAANSVNQAINLTSETTLTAQDMFTQQNISVIVPPVRSDSLTDITVLREDGIVRP